ncbi:hypothetical protein [Desulfobulbus alkaliphilus]|uniref:hypothetical protein n=1 Tax=Desulfobulbus alkaliphilus TaxID=869814 RepID=UPI001965D4B6|nr:hypothetical protein [Desulfobulbus alkaliphilus]MBM9536438.1 hypothetical protein [Desulfobulbus alkaliphilus]
MANVNKKVTAAIAAVNAYMMQEEEAAYQAQLAAARSAQTGPNPWAIAGRQDIMHFRRLIQIKAF